MKREIDINEITKDRLMTSNDMAKIGCGDCQGCHHCCTNMGSSVVLDPYDIMELTTGLNCDFPSLLGEKLQLNVVDGIILPNLAMTAGEENACYFLNGEGRCSIHDFRPGICRLFPLARIYEDGSFSYFLQTKECVKENRTKVKIRHFLGIDNLKEYEKFVVKWHYFLNAAEEFIKNAGDKPEGEKIIKDINMMILNTFYITPISKENFYVEADRRIELVKTKFKGEADNGK